MDKIISFSRDEDMIFFTESGCPIQCLIKAGVFVVLAIFVLYLPLGDPYKHCNGSKSAHGKKMAMCCLCDMYLVSTKVAHKSMEISELIYEWISDLLYELKLKMVQEDLEKKTQRRACRGMRRCKLKNANV